MVQKSFGKDKDVVHVDEDVVVEEIRMRVIN